MDRARRLRLVGTLVLACGIVAAALVYGFSMRTAAIDESAAGFTRAQEHQLKVMMGPLAVAMSGWADALTPPAGVAIMIAGAAAFISYMCFRHARFAEDD